MAKTPTTIEVVQEGDERFLLKTFADGSGGAYADREAAAEAAAKSISEGYARQEP